MFFVRLYELIFRKQVNNPLYSKIRYQCSELVLKYLKYAELHIDIHDETIDPDYLLVYCIEHTDMFKLV